MLRDSLVLIQRTRPDFDCAVCHGILEFRPRVLATPGF
jgi:hypothetical protein